jgi:hypothetical protein
MKNQLTLLLAMFCCPFCYANQIDSVRAAKVASDFFKQIKPKEKAHQFNQVKLKSKRKLARAASVSEKPAYYILNSNSGGFVIISGNDNTKPILGYALAGKIDTANMPPAMIQWLNWKEQEIQYLADNASNGSVKESEEWSSAENSSASTTSSVVTNSQEPLLKTLWGQGTYYNDLCPVDSSITSTNKHVPVGCGATAMAQLMKYWEYPESGSSTHSYSHSKYGTLSADFGNTVYDWASMPNYLTESNNAVAKLCYHCGVSVDMDYEPGGSSSSLNTISQSLKTYFKYASSLSFINKSNYTQDAWHKLIKADIDNKMPVLLRGAASDGTGGHLYVCDGYTDNNYFHINWGWNGSYNGYFLLDDLTPGYGDYSYYQYATIGIKPSGNSCAVQPTILSLAQNSGASDSVRIISNASWTATNNASWLNLNATSGSGFKYLTVTANSQNLTGSTRSAVVTVSVSGISSKSVIITQASSDSLANLLPLKPITWADTMILSNVKGTSRDTILTSSDSIYADFCFINRGKKSITGLINFSLVVDGVIVFEGNKTGGLKTGYYYRFSDIFLGRFKAGSHKIQLILDPYYDINESNENDNVYEKTFTVSEGTPFLNSDLTNISFTYKANSKVIKVFSNVNWTISSDQTWLVPAISSGTGDSNVSLSVSENTTTAPRTAIVTIKGQSVEPIYLNVSQDAFAPNLRPYKPLAWSDTIIISNQQGTSVDDIIYNTQAVYVDYSYINSGTKKTEGTYYHKLYLNDVLKRSMYRTDTLGSRYYTWYGDYSLGVLDAGTYTIKLVVDANNQITESNENDNTYSKQFTVYDVASSLIVSPQTSVVSSQDSTILIDIASKGNWTISNTNLWINISALSGSGNGQIKVDVSKNSNQALRTAKFTITNDLTSKEVSITQNSKTAINDADPEMLHIYPNPVTDKICVTSKDAIDKIVLLSSTGSVLLYEENCGKEATLNVSGFSAGCYILSVKTSKTEFKKNIIKQ